MGGETGDQTNHLDRASELAKRALVRCDALAEITDEPGRITRGFLSPAMERATACVAGWMHDAGLSTELDAAGNLIGTYANTAHDAPVLVLGSHIDTVRDAGRYDGVLGVTLALSVIEALEGAPLPFALEVVAFADEEGLRFSVPFLGSRAMIGAFDPDWLAREDDDGVSMARALERFGGDPVAQGNRFAGRDVLGYVEAHIEQGPCLEDCDGSLAVLEALCGSCWMRLRFDGCAGHAGTTPMHLRRDALPAAAEAVLLAEALAKQDTGLVATVGQLRPSPGASNVIPGCAELSLDLRHPDDRCLRAAIECVLEDCRGIAARRGLTFEHEVLHRQPAVAADPQLSQILRESAVETGTAAEELVIGAGHDSLVMAQVMPIAMLFLRSPGGISHHPEESVRPEDVAAAHRALHAFVLRLARTQTTSDPKSPLGFAHLDEPDAPGGVAWDGEG